ncbi:MAG: S8 family serine peptidase [Bacteroidales bacterium]|nr:S8 family serine peptidase [Bacteroidales bacterium]
MKKILILTVLIITNCALFSQVAPTKYYVQFTDKSDSPYSIDNPSQYLSQKAIDKRIKFNIPIEENDLPVNPSYIQAVKDIGVIILNPTKWLNGTTIQTNDTSKINEINLLPFVEKVLKSASKIKNDNLTIKKSSKPFFEAESYSPFIPSKINTEKNALYLSYGASYNQIHMLNGDALHELGYLGDGITIAILDAGFNHVNTMAAFDYLWLNDQIKGTKDFVLGGEDVFNYHNHGTNVLSTMGAFLPGELIGTAFNADYWLIRSEDGGSEYIIEEYNWVSAAEFVDSIGVDIINSSLGYTDFDDPAQDHTYQDMNGNTTPISRGADIAVTKGILVCNSAGNSGNTSWHYIGAPADGFNVLTIGAVNSSGIYANFSSTGPTYDGRLKPNVVAQGEGTVLASSGGGIFTGNGTSFSSPIIAGMTACLMQAYPDFSNYEIMNAIELASNMYEEPDSLYGYGIPDYFKALQYLSIDEKENPVDNYIKAFPNPFIDELEIDVFLHDNQNIKIELFDICGKLIIDKTKKSNKIGCTSFHITNLENLSSGLYFIKIYSNKNTASVKIIKE